jgi:hypothetical protein
VLGFANIPYTFNDKTEVIRTYIVPSLTKQLFCGMDFWATFDIGISIGVDSIATISIEEADEVSETEFDLRECKKPDFFKTGFRGSKPFKTG